MTIARFESVTVSFQSQEIWTISYKDFFLLLSKSALKIPVLVKMGRFFKEH